ncbi:MAG: hypothetical protein PHD95_03365 [Candidatus ainarchaeum sp.]|nr:hypothetical protein [Candidatus ainarchaeum sp.]
MGAIKIVAVFVVVLAAALVVSVFVFPGALGSFGIGKQTGFFSLGFSKNQLALIGADAGKTEQEKMVAIKNNFFVFEFGDPEKKQLVEQEKLEILQGSFSSLGGTKLDGWLLRIPNIEKGKDYQYEIRIPNYEVAGGQFFASEVE